MVVLIDWDIRSAVCHEVFTSSRAMLAQAVCVGMGPSSMRSSLPPAALM